MQKVYFFLAFTVLFSLGCVQTRATLKTYIDPSIQTSAVQSVAVFSMRNTAFSPGETLEMDRAITQGFAQKNPGVKIIGSAEASRMINDANLTSEFSLFLEDFERSGIANTKMLNKIKNLGADAILQGRLSEISQIDKNIKLGIRAKTTVTVRYTLLSTSNGNILWEGTSNGVKRTYKRFAPPIYELVTKAQEKVIGSIPQLGQ